MKLQAILLAAVLLSPAAALSQQRVYRESYCYENTEEYIPGYYNYQGQYVGGYVKSNRRRVPCSYSSYQMEYNQPTEQRCSATRITLGGLLGGGAAAALSKKDAYGWSIPLGAVLGMGVAQAGCE